MPRPGEFCVLAVFGFPLPAGRHDDLFKNKRASFCRTPARRLEFFAPPKVSSEDCPNPAADTNLSSMIMMSPVVAPQSAWEQIAVHTAPKPPGSRTPDLQYVVILRLRK